MAGALALLAVPAAAQGPLTAEHPVRVALEPGAATVAPGSRSWLRLRILVPAGLWIGAAEGVVRAPGPTRLAIEPDPCLRFGAPRWPEPRVEGIPVHNGTTRIYKGRIEAVIPFEVTAGCPEGKRTIVVRLTYTPGLNAGHLTPHAGERHEARIEVRKQAKTRPPTAADLRPSMEPEAGPQLERAESRLPRPLDRMLFPVPEDSFLARALHRVWEDPPDHGKTVQGLAVPWAFGSKNTGTSVGAGLLFLNTTREGVGTGAVTLRAVHNEYSGATLALDALSCPAAYHNYRFQAFYAEDKQRGARLHVENLTLADGRFGYELQLDAFEDGRYRFFGLGARTEERNETAYTNQEAGAWLDLYWNFAPHWRVGIGGRIRDINVDTPAQELLDEQPSTRDVFPNVAGAGGGTVVSERVTLVFDRRNQEFTPSSGTYARLRAELNHTIGESGTALAERWGRFEVLARHYASTPGQTFTLVLSNAWVLTTGENNIPFFELPSLGGAESLRAFDTGRFTGKNSVLASAELRIQALHMFAMGMPLDVEVAPFIDAGQVFGNSGFRGTFNVNPGMSMRVLNRPNIGLVLNVAFGQDGALFTGGVSLPF